MKGLVVMISSFNVVVSMVDVRWLCFLSRTPCTSWTFLC